MPKGQTLNIHGSIVSVPVNHLPLEGNCEKVILVKLKRKLSFKRHVYFEPVRLQRDRTALEFLQKVNLPLLLTLLSLLLLLLMVQTLILTCYRLEKTPFKVKLILKLKMMMN